MSYLQYLSVAADHNENSLHITAYVLKHITDTRYNRPERGCTAGSSGNAPLPRRNRSFVSSRR